MMRGRFPMVEGVNIRLSSEEKQAMRAAARKSGMTVSEFIRLAASRAAAAA